jgi:hypothetical protein
MATIVVQQGLRRLNVPAGVLWPAIGSLLCVAFLAIAYHTANVSESSVAYLWFWCGLLLGVVPLAVTLIRASTSTRLRCLCLLALAVVTYLPKLFRDAGGPALFDEVLHYGQILKIGVTGALAVPNSLVPVLQYYPGADASVVGLHDVTQLPLWDAGLVLAGLAHVALLAGVYALAKIVTDSPQLAGLAAVVYAVSPGFTFFSTEVAYETIALPLAVWTVVAMLLTLHAHGRHRVWLGLAAAAGIMATGVTHHVTSLLLAALLLVLALFHLMFRQGSRPSWATTGMLSGFAMFAVSFDVLWIGLHSWRIVTYVSPDPRGALVAAQDMLHLSGHAAFSASTLPGYEQVAGLLAAPLVCLLVLVGILRHRSIGTSQPLRYCIFAVAVGYPLSLPLEFTNTGLVWAHRLWPYLYIGVAIVAATAIHQLTKENPLPGRSRWRPLPPGTSTAAIVGLLSLILIGNTATEVNAQTQFPNQQIYAGAASLDSPAYLQVAAWFTAHAPSGTRFVSDPDVAVDLISYTDEQAISTFQTWLLTESTGQVPASVLATLGHEHIAYLIVDRRMYSQVPARGYIYEPYEPHAFAEHQPVPIAAWSALQRQPWAKQVYVSGSLVVFQLTPGVRNQAGSGSRSSGATVK